VLATIQRGSRLMDYELMVEVNIPWQRDVLRANESEAATLRSAAQARHATRLPRNWPAILARTGPPCPHSMNNCRSCAATLLPQSELTFESALSGYQNGRVDFGTLLDAERQIRNDAA
jgi:outer membrane protein, heavy metal efflux system